MNGRTNLWGKIAHEFTPEESEAIRDGLVRRGDETCSARSSIRSIGMSSVQKSSRHGHATSSRFRISSNIRLRSAVANTHMVRAPTFLSNQIRKSNSGQEIADPRGG